MEHPFWLNEAQWKVISEALPCRQSGPQRADDRTIVSGIIYVLSTGKKWRECPASYGPAMTVFNRFNRWRQRKIWDRVIVAMASPNAPFEPHTVAAMRKSYRSPVEKKLSYPLAETLGSKGGPWGRAVHELMAITEANRGKPISVWIDAIVEWHMDRMFEVTSNVIPGSINNTMHEIVEIVQHLHRVSLVKSEAIEHKLKRLRSQLEAPNKVVRDERRWRHT